MYLCFRYEYLTIDTSTCTSDIGISLSIRVSVLPILVFVLPILVFVLSIQVSVLSIRVPICRIDTSIYVIDSSKYRYFGKNGKNQRSRLNWIESPNQIRIMDDNPLKSFRISREVSIVRKNWHYSFILHIQLLQSQKFAENGRMR